MSWGLMALSKVVTRALGTLILTAVMVQGSTAAAEPAPMKLLTLQEAVSLAVENDPAVADARVNLDSAALSVEKSSTPYRPQASASIQPLRLSGLLDGASEVETGQALNFSGSVNLAPGLALSTAARLNTRESDTANFELGLTLDVWPRPANDANYLALLDAREAVHLVKEEERTVRANAALQTYRRYRLLQVEQARTEMLQADSQVKDELYEQAKDKYDKGLTAQTDVLAAQIARDSSYAEHAKALRELEQSRGELAQALGLDSKTEWHLEPLPESPLLVEVQVDETEAIAAAWEENGELKRKKQSLASARRDLNAAREDIGLGVGVTGNIQVHEEEWEQPTYGAYLSVSYDLADGGQRKNRVSEAEIQLKKAQTAVSREQDQISNDITGRISELQWLWDQARIAQLAWQKSQIEGQARSLQAEKGLISETVRQESRNAQERSRLDWVRAVVEYEAARLELMARMGEELAIEGGAVIDID